MTEKQLVRRKKIYEQMMGITALKPWEQINEIVPLIYRKKGVKEPIIFSIWGNSSDVCGVACYLSRHDYIYAMNRLYSGNAKNEPAFSMQNMLLALWGDRDEVSRENKALIKELGYKFRGRGGWLFFESFRERCEPLFLTDEETEVLAEALENLLIMLKSVSEGKLKVDFENGQTVCRSLGKDKKWHNKVVGYKELIEAFPVTVMGDSGAMRKIAAKPSGKLTAELEERCLPIPLEDEETGILYFPLLIAAADAKSGEPLLMDMVSWNTQRDHALFDFIVDLSEKYGKMKEIIINDRFTNASIEDFCQKAGIKLTFNDKPLTHIESIINGCMAAAMSESGMTDGNIFGEMLPGSEPKTSKEKRNGCKVINIDRRNTQTFTISVSLCKGCYRHIRISGGATLETLHSMILDAFCFDDDHAHVFFLDNRAWSEGGYYAGYMEEDRSSCDYTLSQVLEEGQKFLYIFDLGDEWCFQCRVLGIKEEICEEPSVIRSVGEPPEQYPDYDE